MGLCVRHFSLRRKADECATRRAALRESLLYSCTNRHANILERKDAHADRCGRREESELRALLQQRQPHPSGDEVASTVPPSHLRVTASAIRTPHLALPNTPDVVFAFESPQHGMLICVKRKRECRPLAKGTGVWGPDLVCTIQGEASPSHIMFITYKNRNGAFLSGPCRAPPHDRARPPFATRWRRTNT